MEFFYCSWASGVSSSGLLEKWSGSMSFNFPTPYEVSSIDFHSLASVFLPLSSSAGMNFAFCSWHFSCLPFLSKCLSPCNPSLFHLKMIAKSSFCSLKCSIGELFFNRLFVNMKKCLRMFISGRWLARWWHIQNITHNGNGVTSNVYFRSKIIHTIIYVWHIFGFPFPPQLAGVCRYTFFLHFVHSIWIKELFWYHFASTSLQTNFWNVFIRLDKSNKQ